jgi:hypothetical protein
MLFVSLDTTDGVVVILVSTEGVVVILVSTLNNIKIGTYLRREWF